MKTILLFFIFCITTFSTFAQSQMAPVDKANFKTIALSKDQSGTPIIKKWVVPIRYKVYSAKGGYSFTEIDSVFAQIKALTGLDIAAASNDDETNFSIFLGDKADFNAQIPAVTAQYFNKYGGTYYKFNNKGEIFQAINLITVASYTDQREVRNALRRNIIKLFGFFNPLESKPNSIFYSQSNNVVKFDSYDAALIRLLYSPSFTPGMISTQVDEVLGKM